MRIYKLRNDVRPRLIRSAVTVEDLCWIRGVSFMLSGGVKGVEGKGWSASRALHSFRVRLRQKLSLLELFVKMSRSVWIQKLKVEITWFAQSRRDASLLFRREPISLCKGWNLLRALINRRLKCLFPSLHKL